MMSITSLLSYVPILVLYVALLSFMPFSSNGPNKFIYFVLSDERPRLKFVSMICLMAVYSIIILVGCIGLAKMTPLWEWRGGGSLSFVAVFAPIVLVPFIGGISIVSFLLGVLSKYKKEGSPG